MEVGEGTEPERCRAMTVSRPAHNDRTVGSQRVIKSSGNTSGIPPTRVLTTLGGKKNMLQESGLCDEGVAQSCMQLASNYNYIWFTFKIIPFDYTSCKDKHQELLERLCRGASFNMRSTSLQWILCEQFNWQEGMWMWMQIAAVGLVGSNPLTSIDYKCFTSDYTLRHGWVGSDVLVLCWGWNYT